MRMRMLSDPYHFAASVSDLFTRRTGNITAEYLDWFQQHPGTHLQIRLKTVRKFDVPLGWARLLKQKSSITVYRFSTEEKKRPFTLSVWSKPTEVCCLQQTNGSCRFSVSSVFCLRNSWNVEKWKHGDNKRKTEAQAIFLNPFTVCSLCKQNFVVCPFVDEETKSSYPFANGLNGLAHLWI